MFEWLIVGSFIAFSMYSSHKFDSTSTPYSQHMRKKIKRQSKQAQKHQIKESK